MKEDRSVCWSATYYVDGEPVEVRGVETNECPVSLITPESLELVRMFARAKQVFDATGSSIFGLDISRLPAKLVDAIVLMQMEKTSAMRAMKTEAVRRERERHGGKT